LSQAWYERLAKESGLAEERGYRRGMEAGEALGRREAIGAWADERERLNSQVRTLLRSFAQARAEYIRLVEPEAVRLALAIAARILRHQAQMDPLLVTGAVRVALDELAESTELRLRVPAIDREGWEKFVAGVTGMASRTEVIADESMPVGECRLETEIGSADLGLGAQLKEIERGFFDRPSCGTGARLGLSALMEDITNA
jgi:flagellar assembly protein FliH